MSAPLPGYRVRPTPPGAFLVYDGDCAFCQKSVDVAARILPDPFEVVPFQFLDLATVGLTLDQVSRAVWWVAAPSSPGADRVGPHPRGHHAVAALLRSRRSRTWRILGTILDHPPVSWLAGPLYALIARNRHRLPGATPACKVELSPAVR